jgi:capsular exopolysaccharide synthesis family protein
MTLEHLFGILWKRKLLLVTAFALFVAAVTAVTFQLPKSYKTTATVFVGNSKDVNEALAYDTNIGEQLARTYTTLAGNPNIANEVAKTLPFPMTQAELLGHMSFAPVERTQLLEITAEDTDPARARTMANRYAALFVRRVNEQHATGDAPATVALSETAALPSAATKPNPPMYIGLGAVLALLLAAGVALLRERLDDRIGVGADDPEVLGHPVVGRLPVMTDGGASRPEVADGLRLSRATLDLSGAGRAQVLAITSGSPGEGKSTVSASFARTAAADGERVLLIEADLRRPGLAGELLGEGAQRPALGLTSYLAGGCDQDAVVTSHPTLANLDVVFSGPLPPNPTALLRSDRFRSLIDDLRGEYDRVVIDTPPISVGADATLMIPVADGVLFIVDGRTTKRSAATAGLKQIEQVRAQLLGVFVNRIRLPDAQSYGYYAAAAPSPLDDEPVERPVGSGAAA